jgi:predicted RND superfamily exporter protein
MQGMVVVGVAVIAGFGLTALCDISFSPLAGSVVPFLALGLGESEFFSHKICRLFKDLHQKRKKKKEKRKICRLKFANSDR